MSLPPTYRHDYEPPEPDRVYDIPRIVERRPFWAFLERPIWSVSDPGARRTARRSSAGSRPS